MSAVNLHQGSGPTQAKATPAAEPRAYEPSMEEILASIRRIIADDQSLPGRGIGGSPAPAPVHGRLPSAQPPTPGEHAPAPVVMLHAAPHASGVPATSDEPADHDPGDAAGTHHDRHGQGSLAAPQFSTPQFSTSHFLAPDSAGADLHGYTDPYEEPEAGEAQDAPVHGAATAHGYDAVEGGPALFSPSTDHSVTTAFNTLAATRLADNSDDLLGLARDMIRPLLKSWLDDNLPSMVERMVRAEIERVARGGR